MSMSENCTQENNKNYFYLWVKKNKLIDCYFVLLQKLKSVGLLWIHGDKK